MSFTEGLKLFWNKTRIFFLRIFTNRVRQIRITDEKTGKQFDATAVQSTEKVCDHKTITEIAPTMWKCTKCDDCYFLITYKVMLNRHYLVDFAETLASELGAMLHDKKQN